MSINFGDHIVQIIDGSASEFGGFSVRIGGKEISHRSDAAEALVDEAKEISYSTGLPIAKIVASLAKDRDFLKKL